MAEDKEAELQGVLEHLDKMISSPAPPSPPPGVEANPFALKIHEHLLGLREILKDFAKGDLSKDIFLRGQMAGRLKALQANLRHLTWQMQQVAEGDFTQRVEFMGEYAAAFNKMTVQLDSALSALRAKEEELTKLTLTLQHEVAQKDDALEALSKSEARFRYMAEHDALTGVLNRRSFYDLVSMELDRARQQEYGCSLMILDIDFFKKFNDTYGHLEADNVLRQFADVAHHVLRDDDVLGRYGGEEFVVFLPDTTAEIGFMVAERLRIAVAEHPVRMGEVLASVTMSVGLVHVPHDLEGVRDIAFLEEMLSLADSALYKAKNSGRNNVKQASHNK